MGLARQPLNRNRFHFDRHLNKTVNRESFTEFVGVVATKSEFQRV